MPEPQYQPLPSGACITLGLLIAVFGLAIWLIASYPGNSSQPASADNCESIARQYVESDQESRDTRDFSPAFENNETTAQNSAANKTKGETDTERQIAKYNCQLAVYTRDLAGFTRWLVYATTGLIVIGLLQGYFLRRSVNVASIAAAEARDAIKATQASAEAANTHARAAEEANRINREILAATQRPWISVDLAPASALIYRDDGAYLPITCTMKNVGNTPAIYVWPRLCGILQGSQYAAARQRVLIAEARQDQSIARQFGHAIFPGQDVSVLTAILIKNEEINGFQPASSDRTILQITVVGFVNYQPTFDQVWRYTGFSYVLYRTDTEGMTGTGIHPTFYKDAGDILARDLTLRPWFADGDCFFAT
jgi:hypothetical protein